MRNKSRKLIAMACSLTLLVGGFGGYAGMKAGTVQAAGEAESNVIKFEGGSLRLPKNYDVESGKPEEKMTATAKADLRFGYTITLPEEMTMDDVNWSWTWKTTDPIQQNRTQNGTEYVDLGNNQYRTNLVITGIPVSSVYATEITADLTVTGKTDTSFQATCTGEIRSVKMVAEQIKADIEQGASTENEKVQDYVKCLVGTQMANAGTLWDTDSGAEALGGYNADGAAWLESYEGETGIIRLDHDKWVHIYRGMKPVHDKEYYEGCNTLVFKVKTDDPSGAKILTYLAEGKNYEVIVNVTGEWTEVEVPLTNVNGNKTCEGTFEDFWTNYIDADKSMMWVHDGTSTGSHVYIADIKLVKMVELNDQRSIKDCGIDDVVTLEDNSKVAFSGKNLSCYVSRPDGSHYVVTDGTFVPDQQGLYTISYLAEATGATEYGSYQIQVSPFHEAGTLWALDSEESLGTHGSNIKWLDSYDGVTGVVSADFDNSWSVNVFGGLKPVFSKEYYADCDTLVFKVKTDDPSGAKTLKYFAVGKNYEVMMQVTGEWTEVEVPLTNTHVSATSQGSFEEFWSAFIDGDASALYVEGGTSGTSHVYIADIKLVKATKDETLWDTNSGADALGGYNASGAAWLSSHEGETGVICLNDNQWVHIYRGMKPVHDKEYYEGCNTLVFKVKTDDPSGAKTLTYLAEGKNYEVIVNVTGEWTEVEVPLTNVNGNKTCEGTFEDFWTNYIDADTSMMWVHDGTSTNSHVYIADIKLVTR